MDDFLHAINYSYPDSTITLSLMKEEADIVIRIANRGKAVPPEKLTKLFKPFYRMDQSRGTEVGGTGLGLSIAEEIVQLHGGTLQAFGEADLITFVMTLPEN